VRRKYLLSESAPWALQDSVDRVLFPEPFGIWCSACPEGAIRSKVRIAAIVNIESTIPASISFFPDYWVIPAAHPVTRASAVTSPGYPDSDQISLSFG
jgi:hypothetical protein